ncbi:DUF4411 family protein [Pectinatus haikarae]|uniref:DUF4411 family protein n=1 Tax=Pectinatus haikarae TaxID=349096 RepID=UPI0018C48C72|nr:DUF4411 family protein [Pectinatus haikarae]
MDEIYLLDSNTFITPKNSYYPFMMAPSFWKQLKKNLDKFVLLDSVEQELLVGKDDLSEWIDSLKSQITDCKKRTLLKEYRQVLAYISGCEYYNDRALDKWSDQSVADPWLIAASIKNHYKIVTFEKRAGGLNAHNPSGNPKIPDICDYFSLDYVTLFQMMENLHFHL